MPFARFILLLIAFCLSLSAHQLKENYLQVDYNQTTKLLNINLEIETRVLEDRYNFIDDNKNDIVSFKELKNHQTFLVEYALKHIEFISHSRKLSLRDATVTFHRYQDQTYMQLKKSFKEVPLEKLELHYDIYFEFEDTHKLLIHLNDNSGDFVLSKNLQDYQFSSNEMSHFTRLSIFVKEGIIHILDGIDHLLFVLMLLIPTFARNDSYIKLLKIITTFLLAHSLTLFISGFGLYTPNITIVESSIAISIFVVALLNFLGLYSHVSYSIVFLFGLIHGFGFANVLIIAQVSDTTSFFNCSFWIQSWSGV
ncbi:MAG: HupE/UreJ family protein [Epsilonproteobacteria bacterium]|nr:HupE/UreJ family protein [Campylobacterota bacterium]